MIPNSRLTEGAIARCAVAECTLSTKHIQMIYTIHIFFFGVYSPAAAVIAIRPRNRDDAPRLTLKNDAKGQLGTT